MRYDRLNALSHRRGWLRQCAQLAATSCTAWGSLTVAAQLGFVKQALADEAGLRRQLVVLWMSGGPSQIDTFDPKPGHAHGGPVKAISTSVPGVMISEYLPLLAQRAQHLAIVRGLSTKEGDHARGTYLVRTGRAPGTPIDHPAWAASIVKELEPSELSLPSYVAVNPFTQLIPEAYSPGYLGPRYAAANVGAAPPASADAFATLQLRDLSVAGDVTAQRLERRWQLWQSLQQDFTAQHPKSPGPAAQQVIFDKAHRLMNSAELTAFDLSQEPAEVRERYGRGSFGQGCLLARRLLERGVPVVEVNLGDAAGWDTHQDNFQQVAGLAGQLDRGWSSLLDELAERGLLETTTMLCIGEFGRTPQINPMGGRDHFPQAWSCVLAGAGIAAGQAYGATSEDGLEVVDGKASIEDLLATVCRAVGVNPHRENVNDAGRPFKIAEGTPITALLS